MQKQLTSTKASTPPPQLKKAYLFGTCLVDSFYPQVGLDSIALLETLGYRVTFPQDQTCCGQPAYNSGFDDEARKVAERQILSFSPQEIPIIVPSASCAAMVREHYPTLFPEGSTNHVMAANFISRTFELIEFLSEQSDLPIFEPARPIRVALHQSCSAQRHLRVSHHTERLLQKLPNVELLRHAYAKECCGFGGTFAVKSAAVSGAMVTDKCNALLATRPDLILVGDGGCLLNIQNRLEHTGNSTPVQHVISFLRERVCGPSTTA